MIQDDRNAGFTLIELLVVISIIALLAAVLVAVTGDVFSKAETGVAAQQVTTLQTAINAYNSEEGVYPDDSRREGVDAIRDAPNVLYREIMVAGGQQVAKWDIDKVGVYRPGQPTHDLPMKPVSDAEYRNESVEKVFLDPWSRAYHYIEWKSREHLGDTITIPIDRAAAQAKGITLQGEETIQRLPGHDFYVWSNGPNGFNENGAGDDISSWRGAGDGTE